VSKPLTAQMVPPERNFFETMALDRYRSMGIIGGVTLVDQGVAAFGGILVDISSSCSTFAVLAALRARAFG